jgi:hypothetical protein
MTRVIIKKTTADALAEFAMFYRRLSGVKPVDSENVEIEIDDDVFDKLIKIDSNMDQAIRLFMSNNWSGREN